MNPINYSFDVGQPFQSGLEGFKTGVDLQAALTQRDFKQQQMQQAQQQQVAQQQQQEQMRNDLTSLANNPNPTAADYTSVMTKYPQLSEHLEKSRKSLTDEQQRTQLSNANQVYSAVLRGKPNIAADLLANQATAYRNSGDEQRAKAAETAREGILSGDPTVKTRIGMYLAEAMGAEQFSNALDKIGSYTENAAFAPSKLRKSEADARSAEYKAQADAFDPKKAAADAKLKEFEARTKPQQQVIENDLISAQAQDYRSKIKDREAQLELDKDKLTTQTQVELKKLNPTTTLSGDTRKLINESVKTAVESNKSADTLLSLADRFEKIKPTAGAPVLGFEAWKKVVGDQNKITELRTDAERLINSEVIKALPSGNTTDRDIQIFRQGFPPTTADPVYLASFFRGMAKVRRLEATISSSQAKWLKAVGDLGSTPQDIEIAGIKVPSGADFEEFINQYSSKLAGSGAKQSNTQTLKTRNYMMKYGGQ